MYEICKTVIQGCFGAITLGVYNYYTSCKMIKEHNEKQELRRRDIINKRFIDINELKTQINNLK